MKSGEVAIPVTNNGIIYNPTPFSSLPKLIFNFQASHHGGSITINGVTISVQDPDTVDEIVIDCEKQDIYKRNNRLNMNNLFVLSSGEFFELKPGRNLIEFTGLYLGILDIIPNWWIV